MSIERLLNNFNYHKEAATAKQAQFNKFKEKSLKSRNKPYNIVVYEGIRSEICKQSNFYNYIHINDHIKVDEVKTIKNLHGRTLRDGDVAINIESEEPLLNAETNSRNDEERYHLILDKFDFNDEIKRKLFKYKYNNSKKRQHRIFGFIDMEKHTLYIYLLDPYHMISEGRKKYEEKFKKMWENKHLYKVALEDI